MNTFLNADHPLITAMLSSDTDEGMMNKINLSVEQGAEAICFLTESLMPEYKSEESIKKIIKTAQNRPVYVTNYIRNNSQPDLSDEVLATELLCMTDYGASLIDIRTDMFCRSSNEVTHDVFAVKKQKELISQIHQSGCDVLMSAHVFRHISPEATLEIALLQQERGADIAKVVTFADNEKEADDAFRTLFLLKEKLDIPFLFLCSGGCCKKHRLLSPLLGNCMYLCVENEKTDAPQPTIAQAKSLLKGFEKYE